MGSELRKTIFFPVYDCCYEKNKCDVSSWKLINLASTSEQLYSFVIRVCKMLKRNSKDLCEKHESMDPSCIGSKVQA